MIKEILMILVLVVAICFIVPKVWIILCTVYTGNKVLGIVFGMMLFTGLVVGWKL